VQTAEEVKSGAENIDRRTPALDFDPDGKQQSETSQKHTEGGA